MISVTEVSGPKERADAIICFQKKVDSEWLGRAADILRLEGGVNSKTLANLLQGKTPNGRVVQNEVLYREATLRQHAEFSVTSSARRFSFRAPSDLTKLVLHASPRTAKLLSDLWRDSIRNALFEFDRGLGVSSAPLLAVSYLGADSKIGRGLEASAYLINSKFLETGQVTTFAAKEINQAVAKMERLLSTTLTRSLSDDWGLIIVGGRDGLSIQGASALLQKAQGKVERLVSSALSLSPSDTLIRSHQMHRSQVQRQNLIKSPTQNKDETISYWMDKGCRDAIKERIASERSGPSRSKESSDGKSLSR